ncbi:hypothetical protein GXW78_08710 [Roseomonas terrae]|jgi:Ran GTPase-activating protein (RanGAP) involved in mRNA processing and transport|uniref:Uncharacterized protein n=1 Tax=Neoroseomonas terrae TaxID=424799 RepID=A0ABS5EFE3_9PROT|nr:hypothetical protein [Neoroseomonas terrae]MBR0649741.1 hypothetical protein [Neoroseomonas terrae]
MDGLEIEIEGDSDAAVALALLQIVMRAEGKDEGGATADWILSTYQRCMDAVSGEFEAEERDPEDSDEDEEDEDESEEDEAEEKVAS